MVGGGRDGNQDRVKASEALSKETESNWSASPKSQAPSPDPTSRPPERGSDCCRSWLCAVSLIAGHVVSPGGG